MTQPRPASIDELESFRHRDARPHPMTAYRTPGDIVFILLAVPGLVLLAGTLAGLLVIVKYAGGVMMAVGVLLIARV